VQNAADAVRKDALRLTHNYSISTSLLFLDRLGDPQDVPFIESLAVRLLAARWHIATVHLEEVFDKSVGPLDVVLGYRNPRRTKRLAEPSRRRPRIVDQHSAYSRLAPRETEPEVLYARLKDLLRLPVPSL